ncbi:MULTISPECIES: methionine gamma-lyase family protein [Sporomusa]|uniref:methionine gamma-lyase family protein n=1 Tax=Sporomusa TaxID=2375 RepID=UPI0031594ADA
MNLFPSNIAALKIKALETARPLFAAVDDIAEQNTAKVLKAFRNHQVSEYLFRTTTGYGYGDSGRERLEAVWAELGGAEKALVRTQFVSGTHALACVLFGLLRPGDELLAVTGAPYDTMQTVIGYKVHTPGSLKECGIGYRELPMNPEGVNIAAIAGYMRKNTKIALIQRSRGYSLRKPLSIAEIKAVCAEIKRHNPECICFVDNCYGEFVDTLEPTAVGADIMAGSLIKNPGGGIAPSGGYIAGKGELVDMASYRLTAPGLGGELGASLADSRLLYQGLFLAPHVVAQSLKGAIFAAVLFDLLGYKTLPQADDIRSDIIQAIELGSPEKMIAFCQGLQQYSPVDAHVHPVPGPMPGYTDQVIMAGGTFIQGSSIELSADGPLRPPYIVYLQGGLTFEHAMLGILGAASAIAEL